MARKPIPSSPPPKPKKTKAKKEAKPPAASGPVVVDGFLHFSERDLLRYELAQHKIANSLQAVGLKKSAIVAAEKEKGEAIAKAEKDFDAKVRALHGDIAGLTSILKQEEASFLTLQGELASVYDLDLSQVTYDTESGKILVLGETVRRDG